MTNGRECIRQATSFDCKRSRELGVHRPYIVDKSFNGLLIDSLSLSNRHLSGQWLGQLRAMKGLMNCSKRQL